MKNVVTAVSHKGQKVGEVTVPVYESMEELMQTEAPEQILAMFNKANKIRVQGNERARHSEGRVGKQKLRALAYNLLTTEELTNFAGDFSALQAYLDSDEVQARVKEAIELGND